MTFFTGIDVWGIGTEFEPVESATSRALGESVWRVLGLVLLVALCAVGRRDWFVVSFNSIKHSTSLTLFKSIDGLGTVLLKVAVLAVSV